MAFIQKSAQHRNYMINSYILSNISIIFELTLQFLLLFNSTVKKQ